MKGHQKTLTSLVAILIIAATGYYAYILIKPYIPKREIVILTKFDGCSLGAYAYIRKTLSVNDQYEKRLEYVCFLDEHPFIIQDTLKCSFLVEDKLKSLYYLYDAIDETESYEDTIDGIALPLRAIVRLYNPDKRRPVERGYAKDLMLVLSDKFTLEYDIPKKELSLIHEGNVLGSCAMPDDDQSYLLGDKILIQSAISMLKTP